MHRTDGSFINLSVSFAMRLGRAMVVYDIVRYVIAKEEEDRFVLGRWEKGERRSLSSD